MSQLQYIATLGLAKKEIKRVFRIWMQTFLSAAVSMFLFLMIFGHVLGRKMQTIDGFSYDHFILPGLIMMQIITAAYSNAASSVYSQRFNRSIEELFVSPMAPSSIIIGFCLGSIARAIALTILLSIIGLSVTTVQIAHPILLILTVILCSTFLGLAGTLNGFFVRNFDDLSFVTSFILTPMVYLGGVFYNIQRLPPIWRHVSLYNPVVYLIDLFRHAMLGFNVAHLSRSYIVLVVACVILFILNIACIRRGIGIKS